MKDRFQELLDKLVEKVGLGEAVKKVIQLKEELEIKDFKQLEDAIDEELVLMEVD